MKTITITKIKEQREGWDATVMVTDTKYQVFADRDYVHKITENEKANTSDAAHLIEKSFEFLLMREDKEAILRSFGLREIQKYFPEYSEEIKKLL